MSNPRCSSSASCSTCHKRQHHDNNIHQLPNASCQQVTNPNFCSQATTFHLVPIHFFHIPAQTLNALTPTPSTSCPPQPSSPSSPSGTRATTHTSATQPSLVNGDRNAYLLPRSPRRDPKPARRLILLPHMERLLIKHQNIQPLRRIRPIDRTQPIPSVVPDVLDRGLGVLGTADVCEG